MAKPTPTSDSEHMASHSAVFVDTSFSTHLAVLVADSDTVSDLKKKILHEHPLCFPKIGEIEIHALKVKRRGKFYHLSEALLVRNAFAGVNKNWFITVDASRIVKGHIGDLSLNNILLEICGGTCNNLACQQGCKSSFPQGNLCVKQKVSVDDPQVVENLKRVIELLCHDHDKIASVDTNNSSGLDIPEQLDRCMKEKQVQGVGSAVQEEVWKKSGSGDLEGSGAFDGAPETEPHSKKKHKSKKRKRSVHNPDSKEDNISVDESGRNKLDQDTALQEISLGHGVGVVSPGIQMGVKNIADGPSTNLSLDVNEASVAIEMGTDALNVGTEVSREHVQFKDVQCAESLKDASQSESPAKKKHKTENEKGDNQTSRNYSANGVTAETLEDVHLQSSFPGSPKTKGGRKSLGSPKTKGGRKSTKKLSDILPEGTAAIPSSKKNVGVDSSRDEVAANAKILDQDHNAVSLPGQDAQQTIHSEQFTPSPKEINCDSPQEPHTRASQGKPQWLYGHAT
uniref:Uncharacterized protein LOC105644723 isoform X2 n=1 Tax=Rhizophora mucronata TaxID=61149 RepID=A0A2P2IUX4_RHIMU